MNSFAILMLRFSLLHAIRKDIALHVVTGGLSWLTGLGLVIVDGRRICVSLNCMALMVCSFLFGSNDPQVPKGRT